MSGNLTKRWKIKAKYSMFSNDNSDKNRKSLSKYIKIGLFLNN